MYNAIHGVFECCRRGSTASVVNAAHRRVARRQERARGAAKRTKPRAARRVNAWFRRRPVAGGKPDEEAVRTRRDHPINLKRELNTFPSRTRRSRKLCWRDDAETWEGFEVSLIGPVRGREVGAVKTTRRTKEKSAREGEEASTSSKG